MPTFRDLVLTKNQPKSERKILVSIRCLETRQEIRTEVVVSVMTPIQEIKAKIVDAFKDLTEHLKKLGLGFEHKPEGLDG